MINWDMYTPREVDVLQGASLLLRREALDQVGLLDDQYFMYTEEVDLCYRLHKSGWKLFWVPASKIVHYGGQSTKQVATKMFLCLYQSKLIFLRKHYGRMAAQTYKLVLLIATLARLLIFPFSLLESSSKRQHHLALANQYRKLLVELPRM
jgi:GT2 family glycosyltransferase